MAEVISQPGPPTAKAPVEIEAAPEIDDTEVEKDTTPVAEPSDPPPVREPSDPQPQQRTVPGEPSFDGLDIGETATPDTEVDEIVLGARTLSDLGGDPDAIAGIKFDRVEVEFTSTTKRTIGYLNGESTIISEVARDPSQQNIEQRVEDGVSYDVEMREDGSEHLRGRTGDPSNGQVTTMLQPPNIPGAVPSAEPDEPEEEVEVEDPPTRGPDEPTPPAEGRLRRTGERIVSADREVFLDEHGREQVEQLLTVQDSRINGGRPTNIPTVYEGVALRKEDAIQAAMASRKIFESFQSEEEAAEGIVCLLYTSPSPRD